MARAFQGAAALACIVEAGSTAPDYVSMWNEFKSKYGKNYSDLEMYRFATFKQNVDYIYEVNAKNHDFTMGVNEFADLTNEEFNGMYMGYEKPASRWAELQHLGTHSYSGEELADAIDWTAQGAVTNVKNQGQCGSCWSFSTTGAIEGAWQIATKKLVPLSEQEFVDCDKVDNGCQGGLMDNGFKFAEQNALCTEESYPYKARSGTCKKSSCTVGIPQGGVTGFKDVKSDDMKAMMSAVSKQPVSIAIEADKSAFQLYNGGVLSGNCGSKLDHGVLLVGYGTDSGKDYWKVKNSWGASWGEQGYIRMLRGKGGAGECGLLQQASYPVVDGSVPPAPPGPSPGPTPAPSPPSPGSSHYEKPPCQSDEQQFSIQGMTGSGCFPECSEAECPTDVPAGTTAEPKCVLSDQSGNKYCALSCALIHGGCPEGASCQGASIFGSGICLYPDESPAMKEAFVVNKPTAPPNDFCAICEDGVKKLVGKGVDECKQLCKEKAGAFEKYCDEACDLVQTETDPKKVCTALKLCSGSDSIVV